MHLLIDYPRETQLLSRLMKWAETDLRHVVLVTIVGLLSFFKKASYMQSTFFFFFKILISFSCSDPLER